MTQFEVQVQFHALSTRVLRLYDACSMDSIPASFLDAVCTKLKEVDLENLGETSSPWSWIAEVHYGKRRNWTVGLLANQEGTEVSIQMLGGWSWDIDPRYNRVTKISLGGRKIGKGHKVSLQRFKKKVLPLLLSLMVDCELSIFSDNNCHPNLTDTIFRGLFSSTQLTIISTMNCGGKCPEFIKHQISLGHVKDISLYGEKEWPTDMTASLKQFLKAPNYAHLYVSGSNLSLDFEMVSCFVERVFNRKFSSTVNIRGKASFPLSLLRTLYSQSITAVEDKGWITLTFWKQQGRTLTATTHKNECALNWS
uniref:F-box domain-containing protein n=1 Tax=Steinernema glaseri TaxID=37863 RepID=A0A1I7YLS4_9BILA